MIKSAVDFDKNNKTNKTNKTSKQRLFSGARRSFHSILGEANMGVGAVDTSAVSRARKAPDAAPDDDAAPDPKCIRLTRPDFRTFKERAEILGIETRDLGEMQDTTMPACSYFTTQGKDGSIRLMQKEYHKPIAMRQFEYAFPAVATIKEPDPQKIECAMFHLCGDILRNPPSVEVFAFEHPSDSSSLCVLPMHKTITGGITRQYSGEANREGEEYGDATKYQASQPVYVEEFEEEDEGTD